MNVVIDSATQVTTASKEDELLARSEDDFILIFDGRIRWDATNNAVQPIAAIEIRLELFVGVQRQAAVILIYYSNQRLHFKSGPALLAPISALLAPNHTGDELRKIKAVGGKNRMVLIAEERKKPIRPLHGEWLQWVH